MAEVTVEKPRPTVELRLSWEEFEALLGALAVAQPERVVGWLNGGGRDSLIQSNSDLCLHTLYGTMLAAHKKGPV